MPKSTGYLPLKKNTSIFCLVCTYLIVPLYLFTHLRFLTLKELVFFYFLNVLVAFYLISRSAAKSYQLRYNIQKIQEQLNVLEKENSDELKKNASFNERTRRYASLRGIIEEINLHLDLDYAADKLASIAFSLIANNKGVCLLYLLDNQTQGAVLFKSKKEDAHSTIKAKEGDVFDIWVLRHFIPLFIQDVRRDYRFDVEKLKHQDKRTVISLISSPLLSGGKFVGLLRLDHQTPNFYSQDDLRLLNTISDVGAVALEASELFEKTQDMAIHDGLTTLFTKGYFLERLEEECKRGLRHKSKFCILMLDIDFFKKYNDKFGHAAGDIVLRKIAQILKDSLKDLNPVISRFGGEEFCVFLPDKDKKEAYGICEHLRQRIEKEKIILRRQETNVTISIGIAAFPADSASADELMSKSDGAMYEAKLRGRNQVCCL